jgi:hypothetical protein
LLDSICISPIRNSRNLSAFFAADEAAGLPEIPGPISEGAQGTTHIAVTQFSSV